MVPSSNYWSDLWEFLFILDPQKAVKSPFFFSFNIGNQKGHFLAFFDFFWLNGNFWRVQEIAGPEVKIQGWVFFV